jgi:NAD(P)-dependent dehydrogenase (short-subunit alcohol dehydrogenase family)
VIETNLFGTYHGMRAVLPYLREQGSGTIVNVASVLSRLPAPHQSAYVASKHAVRALSDCVRQELADSDEIHVCTVLPGPIDTPLFHHAANYTGRRVKPPSPVIDAHRVAQTIVSCARRPRREAVVGIAPRVNIGAVRAAPGAVERAARRVVEKDHFDAAPAVPTDGNLRAPDDGPGFVSGGWDRSGDQVGPDLGVSAVPTRAPRPARAAAGVGIVAVLAIAAGVVARRR